ncbi:MAG TPA: hypothetical protein VLZ77_06970 [Acidimicrobiales bacterium]|nr:hypothetical protein [Acidimicrobiales bacterium]
MSTNPKLQCRVEDLGDGWDAMFIPGAVIDEAAVFLVPHRDGADGLVEVAVVRRAHGEAVVEVLGMSFLSGAGNVCRVPTSALAA